MSCEADELLKLLEDDKQNIELGTLSEPSAVKPIEVSSQPCNDNLTKIMQARDQIAEVKKNLSTIVDSIANNPSLITRASDAWGAWPTWQKVGTGIVLTVPAILVGVAASVGSLLVIGGATGVVYTTTGFVLEDHHVCNVNIKQRLKEGILSLADVLELTIVALDTIRLQLAEEISKFKEENSKLALRVSTLQDQVHTLSIQVELLVGTEAFLRATRVSLEMQVHALKASAAEQSETLKKTQHELEEVISHYQINQKQLSEKVAELRTVREQMSQEIAKTKQVSDSLQKAVITLSGVMLEDQKQREGFQGKIAKLQESQEQSAAKVIERLNTTQSEFESVSKDLRFNNTQHQELLAKQESLFKRLEALDLKRVEALDLKSLMASSGNAKSSVATHSIFAKSVLRDRADDMAIISLTAS